MLKLKALALLTLLSASCLVFTSEARAETVVLTGGSVHGSFGATSFVGVTGTDGFSVSTTTQPAFETMKPDMCTSIFLGTACSPGQVVNGSSTVSIDQAFPVSAALNGVQYPVVALQGTTLRFVTGPFTLQNLPAAPPNQDATYQVVVPFTMTGTIVASGFDPHTGGSDGNTFFTLDVAGSGVATLFVVQTGTSVVFSGANYAFQPQPTPEPATLILFGGGLAGLAARARRRRSRS